MDNQQFVAPRAYGSKGLWLIELMAPRAYVSVSFWLQELMPPRPHGSMKWKLLCSSKGALRELIALVGDKFWVALKELSRCLYLKGASVMKKSSFITWTPDLPSFQAVLVNQLVRPCQAHHVCQSLPAFLENLFDHKDPVVPSLQQDLLGQGALGDLLNPPCQGHLKINYKMLLNIKWPRSVFTTISFS